MIKTKIESNLNRLYHFHFSFITTSYNQSKFIIKNLDSIRKQFYKNYKVYYVNDSSTDNTKKILKNYKNKYPNFNIEIFHNKKRKGPAYSRHKAYMKTNDDDICIFLDGDDFLLGRDVLNILAEAYTKYDVYATFGSFTREDKNMNWIENTMVKYDRKNHNYFPHLRTVKSFILKQIPISYLKDNNNEWFIVKTDVALFTAVIELCYEKYMFILNKLVIYNTYNSKNNINDGYYSENEKMKKRRIKYGFLIKNMKKLIPLKFIENFNNSQNFRNNFILSFIFLLVFAVICIYILQK